MISCAMLPIRALCKIHQGRRALIFTLSASSKVRLCKRNLATTSAVMADQNKFIKLANGSQMPICGLGTWKSKPGEVTDAVKCALGLGYRHIDAAFCYANENEVGAGIKAKIDDGTVKREDIFVTSKIWNTKHHPDDVEGACQESLDLLGLAYLDLYLIHWPMAYKRGEDKFPKDENGKWIFTDTDYVDTWKAMEKLVASGKCKAIGVSNFNKEQIQRILDVASVPVANVQVELHPWLAQKELVDFCKSKSIVVTAYSPLGSPDRPWIKDDDPRLMEDPVVKAIAKEKGKTPAQILIRYSLERGLICIPKSVTPSRIESNFEALTFELNANEMKRLMDLDRGYRGVDLTWINHKLHPWKTYEPDQD